MSTSKLKKQFTDRTSDPEDDNTSSACEDKFESKSNTNGTQISQKHQLCQTFYDTWVEEVLHEWKKNLLQLPHAPTDKKAVH